MRVLCLSSIPNDTSSCPKNTKEYKEEFLSIVIVCKPFFSSYSITHTKTHKCIFSYFFAPVGVDGCFGFTSILMMSSTISCTIRFISPAGFTNGRAAGEGEEEEEAEEGGFAAAAALLPAAAIVFAADALGEV